MTYLKKSKTVSCVSDARAKRPDTRFAYDAGGGYLLFRDRADLEGFSNSFLYFLKRICANFTVDLSEA
jgi:hypothetical protein